MKKIVFLLALLSSIVLFAQEESVIRNLPQNTAGYLVLNNSYDYSVDYYTVEIVYKTYDNFEMVDEQVVETFEIIGTIYMQISDEYLEIDNMFVNVTAHLENGEDISEEDAISTSVFGGSDYFLQEKWVCVGSTFAYEIQKYRNSATQEQYFAFADTHFNTQGSSATPYYEYVGSGTVSNIDPNDYVNNGYTNPNTIMYRDYHDILVQHLNSPNSTQRVIRFPNPWPCQPHYKNAAGTIITDPIIYGVQKYKGPWAISLTGTCLQPPVLTDFWVGDIMGAIDVINIYGDPTPCGMNELGCDGTYEAFPQAAKIDTSVKDFNILPLDTIVWVWEIPEEVEGIANLGVSEDWLPYGAIIVNKISGTPLTVVNIAVADMIDAEGEWIDIPLDLSEGLYEVLIFMEDGSIYPIHFEKSGEGGNTFTMSDYLNVNIFPVPIEEEYFNMTLSATQSVDFEYTLYSFNGEPIYNSTFVVENGNSETFQIEPEGGLQSGYYINYFEFSDGSHLSVLTVKND
jgi:hypothetical protein